MRAVVLCALLLGFVALCSAKRGLVVSNTGNFYGHVNITHTLFGLDKPSQVFLLKQGDTHLYLLSEDGFYRADISVYILDPKTSPAPDPKQNNVVDEYGHAAGPVRVADTGISTGYKEYWLLSRTVDGISVKRVDCDEIHGKIETIDISDK